ncbi:MAG TPA: hypothetical protein VJA16_23815 [Thermoanaerobaculia bacterium]
MTRRRWATLLYAALAALYLLHNDLWLWNDSRLWLGLPAGLVYHIGFCIAVSVVLGLMVVYAWPPGVPPGVPSGAGETRPIPPPRGQGEHG